MLKDLAIFKIQTKPCQSRGDVYPYLTDREIGLEVLKFLPRYRDHLYNAVYFHQVSDSVSFIFFAGYCLVLTLRKILGRSPIPGQKV